MKIENPLSGNVTETFSMFWKDAIQQLGFINITNTSNGDSDLEMKIIQSEASYGRQLGRMMEAMEIAIKKLDRAKLNQEEKDALDEFTIMARRIRQIKIAYRPVLD